LSLGYTEGFRAFEAAITLGKREGYYHGRQSISSSGFRTHQCAGGEPSNGGTTNNSMPAIANGSMKKLLMSAYVDGGGRIDCYSRVNAAVTLQGIVSSVGKVEINFDDPFVIGDIINWQFQRNDSNGTFEYGAFMEIEWDDLETIKHWYGGLYRGGTSSNTFWEIGEMTMHAIFPLTVEKEFQRPMLQSGTILDYGYYGSVPVSVDNTPLWDVRVNGVSEATNPLTAGFGFQNFVGVNIPFVAGDLINLMGRSPSSTVVIEGLPTMRIQFG